MHRKRQPCPTKKHETFCMCDFNTKKCCDTCTSHKMRITEKCRQPTRSLGGRRESGGRKKTAASFPATPLPYSITPECRPVALRRTLSGCFAFSTFGKQISTFSCACQHFLLIKLSSYFIKTNPNCCLGTCLLVAVANTHHIPKYD